MSNDTVFTEENKNLLRDLQLFEVTLEKVSEDERRRIEWTQTLRNPLGNEEEYVECTYRIRDGRTPAKVKVFVASACGAPPPTIHTASHHQGEGRLHFGYIYQDDHPNVKAIFFVIHPNSWGPYQKRFRTNTMLSLVDGAINEVGGKIADVASKKAGIVAGAAIGSLIPVPVVGTVGGAIVGYCVAEVTTSMIDGLAGDYLRFIG